MTRRAGIKSQQRKQQELDKRIESLQFENDLERTLFEKATLGVEAEMFWNSPFGLHLRQKMITMYATSIRELVNVDPGDTKKIMDLQVEARVAERITILITEAITTGQEAEQQIEADEDVRQWQTPQP